MPAAALDRYRYAVLMLGQFGLPEARIQTMTQPELDGFLRQAALLRRGQAMPLLFQTAFAPPPALTAGGNTQTFISKRRKK